MLVDEWGTCRIHGDAGSPVMVVNEVNAGSGSPWMCAKRMFLAGSPNQGPPALAGGYGRCPISYRAPKAAAANRNRAAVPA